MAFLKALFVAGCIFVGPVGWFVLVVWFLYHFFKGSKC